MSENASCDPLRPTQLFPVTVPRQLAQNCGTFGLAPECCVVVFSGGLAATLVCVDIEAPVMRPER